MIMVTFDGTSVTPDIRKLIEKYHVGGILLTPNNIRGTVPIGIAGYVSLIQSRFYTAFDAYT